MKDNNSNKSDTMERILQAAEDLFAAQGFDGTSTRQIASMAGISIQTLHYHGGSKKDLYDKILERSVIPVTKMINDHIQRMIKLDLGDDEVFSRATGELIEDLFDILSENPNYPLLFFRQWLEQDPDLRRVEWEQIIPFIKQWIDQVETIVTRERTAGLDLPLTFISLSMLYWGLFSNRGFITAFLELEYDSPEYMERLKQHAKELTSRLLAAKPEKKE